MLPLFDPHAPRRLSIPVDNYWRGRMKLSWVFLLISLLASLAFFTKPQTAALGNLSRWAFLLTFAGVGLRTNLRELGKQGARPFLVGAIGEVAIAAITRMRANREWKDSPALFFGAWAIFPALFFSFSESKLPGYVLPAIPPVPSPRISAAPALWTAPVSSPTTSTGLLSTPERWQILSAPSL